MPDVDEEEAKNADRGGRGIEDFGEHHCWCWVVCEAGCAGELSGKLFAWWYGGG